MNDDDVQRANMEAADEDEGEYGEEEDDDDEYGQNYNDEDEDGYYEQEDNGYAMQQSG